MKAVYVQEGKNLDYQNTGSTVIAAGEVVVLGGHIALPWVTLPWVKRCPLHGGRVPVDEKG